MFYNALIINMVGLALCSGTPQVILVNNMLLPNAPVLNYTFYDGDLVDVMCAQPTTESCNLKMYYDYRKHYRIPDIKPNKDSLNPKNPAGFQLRMGAANHNTHAICTCNNDTEVKINFYMKRDPPGISDEECTKIINDHWFFNWLNISRIGPKLIPISVYINDIALRPTTDSSNADEAFYKYLYKLEQDLDIICESLITEDKAQFSWKIEPRSTNHNFTDLGSTHKLLKLVEAEELQFECKTKNYMTIVTLKLNDLFEANNLCTMQVELKHLSNEEIAHPSLQIYESKNRYFVYEYEEKQNFVLTCIAKCQRVFKMTLVGSGSNSRDSDTNQTTTNGITTVNLTGYIYEHHYTTDKVFQCNVNDQGKEEPFMVRTLVLEPYVLPSTTTAATTMLATTRYTETLDEETEPSQEGSPINMNEQSKGIPWILVAVVIVAIIIIICVSAVIYKIKNRKNDKRNPQRHPSDVNYVNLPHDTDSPIPPFPRKWDSLYAEPVDRTEEPTYCEPCVGARANVKNELYTTAIPKTRRKPANIQIHLGAERSAPTQQTDDPAYVEIPPNNAAFKNELNLMYAKVVPKSQRSNLNKNDYVNVDDSPNYAEVVPKSIRPVEREGASGKYVNVRDGRYANTNSGSEYAEPAYCEPTYLNKKK